MTEREHHEYQGGPWTAVAHGAVLALVEPDAPWRLVDGLWGVATSDGDVLAALNVVAADGFTALPRFAVVRHEQDGSVHAVLRGPVRLRLHGADGAQEVAAGDGAVWTEHRAVGVRGLEVLADGVADATWWPLVGGVVRAGGLRTGVTAHPAVQPEAPALTHEQPVVAVAAPAGGTAPAVDPWPSAAVPGHAPEPAAAAAVVPEPVAAPEPFAVPGPSAVPEPVAVAEPSVEPEPLAVPEHVVLQEQHAAPVAPADPAAVPLPDVAVPTFDTWPATSDATAVLPPVPDASPEVGAWPADVPAVDAPAAVDEAAWADASAPSADASAPVAEPEQAPEIPWWPLDGAARDAAPPAVAPVPVPAADPRDEVAHDDHDGMTILSSDLARLRDRLPAWSQDAVPGPFPTPEPEPLPARMVLSTGLVVALDRPVLLGRAPQVARVTNRELPRLVTVPSPNQDISRTHAEVRVEGEHVVVTDLESTNGVHVSRPGEGVRRLHPGEPSVVGTDEVVDLGDGVTFTVERSAS